MNGDLLVMLGHMGVAVHNVVLMPSMYGIRQRLCC